jgi:hypothetical protein
VTGSSPGSPDAITRYSDTPRDVLNLFDATSRDPLSDQFVDAKAFSLRKVAHMPHGIERLAELVPFKLLARADEVIE